MELVTKLDLFVTEKYSYENKNENISLGLVDVYCWIFVQNNWGNNLLSRSL